MLEINHKPVKTLRNIVRIHFDFPALLAEYPAPLWTIQHEIDPIRVGDFSNTSDIIRFTVGASPASMTEQFTRSVIHDR